MKKGVRLVGAKKYNPEKRRKHYEENIKREKFYNSKKWKEFRNLYFEKMNGICELCNQKGLTVAGENLHHIIELTEGNIHDEKIALDEENVILLCINCHNIQHERDIKENKKNKMKYSFNEKGELIDNSEASKT
jgi:5-methylcytosine-specific restriction enzyme A